MKTDFPFIDLTAQRKRINDALERHLRAVFEHGAYIAGPEVEAIENRLARFAGVRHAVTCASGTAALELALSARGIGHGDAVFVPAFSFFATAGAVARAGATPVMVDIDAVDFCISPAALEKAVNAVLRGDASIHPLPSPARGGKLNPALVVTVDLFGQTADYGKLLPLAERYGLAVLEDAAQSFGARHGDKKACGLGCWAAATSFYPTKPLGCYGDGGALFTDDDAALALFRSLRDHGKDETSGRHVRIGSNERFDTLQAAVLLAKMDVFEDEIAARRRAAAWYADAFSGIPEITVPRVADGRESVWAQYSVLVAGGMRDALALRLREKGIPTGVYYRVPLHLEPAFLELGYAAGDMPAAEKAADGILALPFHPYLTRENVELIAEAVADAVRVERRNAGPEKQRGKPAT